MKLSSQQVCQNVYGFAQAQPLFPAAPCIDAVVTSRTREPSLTSTPLFRSSVHGEGCMSYGMPMMLSRNPSKSSSGIPSVPPHACASSTSEHSPAPRFPKSPSLSLFLSGPDPISSDGHTLVTSARRPSNNPHRPLASSDSHLRRRHNQPSY